MDWVTQVDHIFIGKVLVVALIAAVYVVEMIRRKPL